MLTKTCYLLIALGLAMASCAAPAAPAAKQPPKQEAPAEAKLTSPTASVKQASESPQYGGVLTSYLTGNPPSLDVEQEGTMVTSMTLAPVYNSLVQADPLTADKFVPGLAERWDMSQDGLTWTFEIRQGVKWHDGTPFTVDDVLFSLQRMTNPPKGIRSAFEALLKPVVKSIEKEGNKLKITLNDPFAPMLDTMGHNYFVIYSKAYVDKHGDMTTTAMGTGPFKLKSYTPGVSLEGIKNADFWVKGRPYLDGYRYLILRDPQTQMSSLRTGKINLTGKQFATLRPNDMEMVKKENPQIKFYPSQSLLGPGFFVNVRRAPFQDQKVRKAVSLALDRQAALKVLGQGYGVIGKPFPTEPWGIPMNELLAMPGYRQPKDADMAEARKLMQAAGYPDGFEMTINARQMWQSREAATFMTNQLAPLGIRAKVQVMEDAVFWDTGRKGGHDAMVYTPAWSSPDPHWLGRFVLPGAYMNYSGSNDEPLSKMWDDQIKIVDAGKRNVLVRKIEERLLDDANFTSIVWPYTYIGVRPEVRQFSPGMSDYVGNSLEEIWLAK